MNKIISFLGFEKTGRFIFRAGKEFRILDFAILYVDWEMIYDNTIFGSLENA